MRWNFIFFFNSILLGVGLAMDAFSVSLANGLNEPLMNRKKMCKIAGIFAVFQALMPMIGWVCVHTVVKYLHYFEKLVPWIAFALLLAIGLHMIEEGIHPAHINSNTKTGIATLLVQAVATSIDALSVGFTISSYGCLMALTCAAIIAIVTFFICILGLIIGKSFGTKLSYKASVFGGIILIFIGLEIFLSGFF